MQPEHVTVHPLHRGFKQRLEHRAIRLGHANEYFAPRQFRAGHLRRSVPAVAPHHHVTRLYRKPPFERQLNSSIHPWNHRLRVHRDPCVHAGGDHTHHHDVRLFQYAHAGAKLLFVSQIHRLRAHRQPVRLRCPLHKHRPLISIKLLHPSALKQKLQKKSLPSGDPSEKILRARSHPHIPQPAEGM